MAFLIAVLALYVGFATLVDMDAAAARMNPKSVMVSYMKKGQPCSRPYVIEY